MKAGPDAAVPVLSTWGLVGTVGCVVAGVLPAFMIGGLSVQVSEELHFGEAALGVAVAAFFAAAAFTSVFLGRLSERVGPGRALRWAGAASGCVLLAVAAAARSLPSLVVILAAGGVANAAAQPAANLVIAHTAAKHRQGFLLGLKQGAIPLSTLAAGLAVPAVALTVGWRWAFVAGGVLAFGAVALVPGSESIVRAPRPSVGGSGHVPDAPMSALILLTVGLATAAFATGSLGAFVVQSGVDAGLAEGTAGYVLAVGSAGAFIVYLLAGSYADVRRGLELKMTAAMLAVGAVCLAVLALGVPAAFLAAGPIAFTIGWGWPGLFNIAVMRSSPSAPGAATGITQTGAYVGVVLGPPAFGLLAEHWSYTVAWSAAAVCSLLSALVVLAGHRRLHRDAQIATQPPSTAIT